MGLYRGYISQIRRPLGHFGRFEETWRVKTLFVFIVGGIYSFPLSIRNPILQGDIGHRLQGFSVVVGVQ